MPKIKEYNKGKGQERLGIGSTKLKQRKVGKTPLQKQYQAELKKVKRKINTVQTQFNKANIASNPLISGHDALWKLDEKKIAKLTGGKVGTKKKIEKLKSLTVEDIRKMAIVETPQGKMNYEEAIEEGKVWRTRNDKLVDTPEMRKEKNRERMREVRAKEKEKGLDIIRESDIVETEPDEVKQTYEPDYVIKESDFIETEPEAIEEAHEDIPKWIDIAYPRLMDSLDYIYSMIAHAEAIDERSRSGQARIKADGQGRDNRRFYTSKMKNWIDVTIDRMGKELYKGNGTMGDYIKQQEVGKVAVAEAFQQVLENENYNIDMELFYNKEEENSFLERLNNALPTQMKMSSNDLDDLLRKDNFDPMTEIYEDEDEVMNKLYTAKDMENEKDEWAKMNEILRRLNDTEE